MTNEIDKQAQPDETAQLEIEAAVFRRLIQHFQENTHVQNIDLMNLSGFCRNCLSRWYMEAAQNKGHNLDKDAAREIVYGMPYATWKDTYQTEANAEQLEKFEIQSTNKEEK